MSAAYLDASAVVKLFKPEPETKALRRAISQSGPHISSELVVVEALCVARRLKDERSLELAALALGGIDLIPFGERVRNRASATAFHPPLRALDAIHLATALLLKEEIGVLFAYDLNLCDAASGLGLAPESPS